MKASVAKTRIQSFRDELMEGINGIVRASEIYVEAIDDDPSLADKFREDCADFVPASAWSQFEAVGRKWMHPRLIMGGMADRKKANLVKRLPFSTQERVFSHNRFDLLVSGGDILKVDMMEATQEQAEQLCNGSEIRTIPEQKAWLEAVTIREENKPEVMPYTIVNGKVSFRRAVTLTRQELKRLLQEM